jgi:hypothetical protein
MKLTAEILVDVLAATSRGVADRAESVALVRAAQPSFGPTLYSAWRVEGDDLDPGLRHDLDRTQARVDFYRRTAAELARRVPQLIPIKGLEVADLYPEGIVRAMNDLDLVAADERDLWSAAAWLTADGWTIDTATFFRYRGALQVMVSLRRPHPDPYQLPYGVEIATYFALGDLAGIGPVVTLPADWRQPPVKNLLMLLCERFEQPYRARDLVDAALLCSAMTADHRRTARHAVARLGLNREYAELAGLVGRGRLPPLPALRPRPWSQPVHRARRLARGTASLARPVIGTARNLQRRDLAGTSGRVSRRLSELIWPRIPVPAAIAGGLLAFGLPLAGPAPPVSAATLCSRGTLAWVDTPVARFLLTIGGSVAASAVDELTMAAMPDAATPDAATPDAATPDAATADGATP